MAEELLSPPGIVVQQTALTLPRARALAETLASGRLPYVALVDCLQHDDAGCVEEAIVFEVEVERPQQRTHDVRRHERIAVTFKPADNWYPEVAALRADFPKVPHTNLRPTEFPRSLCLYDQPWSQIALRWTPTAFIERIRFWLAETAKGTLHQDDQPLEPLLFSSGYHIILPSDYFATETEGDYQELKIALAYGGKDCRTLIAEKGQGAEVMAYLALSFVANPQMHGAIRHSPQNLRELAEFLQPAGIDLIEAIRAKLADWNKPKLLAMHVLFVIAFPLLRAGQATVESTDLWVFFTLKNVEEVGIAIGHWEKSQHGLGTPLKRDPAADGSSIPLDIISPHFDISRASAAAASGLTPDVRPMVAVGAGALGSQTLRLLAQSGFGVWCVIDEDILLPHNLARHALNRGAVGMPKAATVAISLQQIYHEEGPANFVEADILHPGDNKGKIEEQLLSAELVLDMAAAIPVSRHLAHEAPGAARRISLFLNPRGNDLVLLAEDADRMFRLDCLEMQYYRALCQTAELRNHLAPLLGSLRYARSCRDVSATIPNHSVAMHAAIGAKGIRQATQSNAAAIRIWHSDPETLDVRRFDVAPSPIHRNQIGPWTLVMDQHVQGRISELRQSKLPKETGGVLLGAYDLGRKIIYVVDTIPSPPDSEEWPTLYIRGKKGLAEQVKEITTITDSQLEYVGEWHSHPDNCACRPSDDDLKVFAWLTENMADAGLPALMAIAGQGPIVAWYLGVMLRSGGWEVGF